MSEVNLNQSQREQIRELAKLHGTAMPSILLFLSSFVVWGASLWLFSAGIIPAAILVLLCVCSFTMGYTPFHEAVHGSVSKWKFLNAWIGRLTASMLFSPYQGFRYVHLKHHRFTNREGADPDLWSAYGLVLLRWLTQDIYYYYIYLKERHKQTLRVRVEVLLQASLMAAIAYWACRNGYARMVILGWILPARLAIAWLAFTFTWLPHYPHNETLQNTAYKATCVRSSGWLDWPLFLQNYHLIHHLYPSVPFYRYKKIWTLGREYFLQQGTREVKSVWSV